MFTGLVQDVGVLRTSQGHQGGARLQIETNLDTSDWEIGESVAVQGACLTVTAVHGRIFHADCSPETLANTTLGDLGPGRHVHLERALRLGDRLGGHIVSGHIDCVGHLQAIREDGNAYLMQVKTPQALMRYLIHKGSITIDGVSLTVNEVEAHAFWVAIIPHTWSDTHFAHKKVGDAVNLEMDMIGKYVERLLLPHHATPTKPIHNSRIDMEFLKKHGFS